MEVAPHDEAYSEKHMFFGAPVRWFLRHYVTDEFSTCSSRSWKITKLGVINRQSSRWRTLPSSRLQNLPPRSRDMASNPFSWIYSILQWVLIRLFSPEPPPPGAKLHRPKIAVVGAGLTGVSAASHCVGHGFDVVLFEAEDRAHLGGIWTVSNASRTSL